VRTRRAAKSPHAATIDKAEHAFAATGIHPYKPNVTSDVVLTRLRSLTKMSDENMEGTEDGHSDVDSPLVDSPYLLTPVSPQKPDNIATARKCYTYKHCQHLLCKANNAEENSRSQKLCLQHPVKCL
jgi:hypothetical protein